MRQATPSQKLFEGAAACSLGPTHMQAVPAVAEVASRELWKLLQHHRPFCQPLALSPLLQRLLEHPEPVPRAQAGQVSPLQTQRCTFQKELLAEASAIIGKMQDLVVDSSQEAMSM